jgi:hypothetical protein
VSDDADDGAELDRTVDERMDAEIVFILFFVAGSQWVLVTEVDPLLRPNGPTGDRAATAVHWIEVLGSNALFAQHGLRPGGEFERVDEFGGCGWPASDADQLLRCCVTAMPDDEHVDYCAVLEFCCLPGQSLPGQSQHYNRRLRSFWRTAELVYGIYFVERFIGVQSIAVTGVSDQRKSGLHESLVGEQCFGYRADSLASGVDCCA